MRWQTDTGEKVAFKRLNVKLLPEDHKALREVAVADGRPMQVIFVDLVKKFVKEMRKK